MMKCFGERYAQVIINDGGQMPNIFIPRFENDEKASNPALYPLTALDYFQSCQITGHIMIFIKTILLKISIIRLVLVCQLMI